MRPFYILAFLLFTLSSNAQTLFVSIFDTPETCSSGNGTATVDVSGGTPPYAFAWSNGGVSSSITNLSAGTYTVTVTDNLGATGSSSITITNSPSLLNASMSFIVPGTPGTANWPCNSNCDGIAYLNHNNIIGVPPYYITLENTTNPNIQPSQVGAFLAMTNICQQDQFETRVYDAVGCSSIVFTPSPFPLADFSHTMQVTPACFGLNNGALSFDFLNLTGGLTNSAMSLSYTGPQSGTAAQSDPISIPNLLPGTYTINVGYPMNVSCDTSFTVVVPDLGVNCGVISGTVFLDTLSNCIADSGEPLIPQQLIRFDPGPYFAMSDSAGHYSASLPFNTYTATLLSTYPLHPVCNANGLTITPQSDTLDGIMLGDSVNMSVAIHTQLTSSFFRPGFVGTLYVNVVNDSYEYIPYPQIEVYYDSLLTYVSSNIPPQSNTPGHLTWVNSFLEAFESQIIQINFQIPPDVTLLGTPLSFTATSIAGIPEPDTTDNTDSLLTIIRGAYDPNDKAVWPSRDSLNSYYKDIDGELRYTIRFQNTGTDTAFTVLIVDTLASSLDPSTFRLLAASHPVQVEFSGQNTVGFRFNNILLPDSNINEPESHGVVSFAISPSLPITVSSIDNRADIYFDFNPPVLTNVVSSFITTSVGMQDISAGKQMLLYPNPTSREVTMMFPRGSDGSLTVKLINMMGEVLLKEEVATNNGSVTLRLPDTAPGVYLITSENQQRERQVGRLVIR